MELDKIYNMDCLEGMKRIPDGSIDAIICDLPYGTTACAWDSVIPFDKLWEQYRRICKKGAPIILFGSEPFSTVQRMSNLEWYKYDWIWLKNNVTGFVQAKNMPLKDYEIASVFCEYGIAHEGNERRMIYNPILMDKTKKVKKADANRQRNMLRIGGAKSGEYVSNGSGYPTMVLAFDQDTDNHFHPTQKPVDLLRYLVLTYTNEGDTVLDNCMGSGTTAIACIKEKRHFIGFELNKEYYDKACKRIDNEQRQQTLF